MRHRAYFDLLFPLVEQRDPRRAVVLMGPRRVGKTVILHHVIQRLISDGANPIAICYVDLQTPTYSGLTLERLLRLSQRASGLGGDAPFFMFYDEVQYLNEWAVQLKNVVDSFSAVKFVVSGSAAAALRLKSVESGAGRFTDFLLPPVTFYEYLVLIGHEPDSLVHVASDEHEPATNTLKWFNIEEINYHFVNYMNFGGFPEAILSQGIQNDPGRFLRSDIIEKVVAKDLPTLYGIQDIAELNRLFSVLAYNTAQEVSLDAMSTGSGVVKQTIKRYVEYLESAFLIKIIHRVDQTARRFKKANFFKVYLTNPCMRCALFGPISSDSEHVGSVVETAVFAQWFHSEQVLHYARWQNGEVDIVELSNATQKPRMAVEIKWSDDCTTDFSGLKSLRRFLGEHPKCLAYVTTRTASCAHTIDDHQVVFIPSAVYCYYIGWLTIGMRRDKIDRILLAQGAPVAARPARIQKP